VSPVRKRNGLRALGALRKAKSTSHASRPASDLNVKRLSPKCGNKQETCITSRFAAEQRAATVAANAAAWFVVDQAREDGELWALAVN
jgi:hypothetical protein